MEEREQTCDICYETVIGSDNFTITVDCNHFFCKVCIKDYLESNVNAGRVINIACPSQGCKSSIGKPELQDCGSTEDMIKKFDEFTFNLQVEMDDSVTWCPRPDCNSPAQLIPNSTHGKCNECYFHFCSECREKYHNYDLCPENPDPPVYGDAGYKRPPSLEELKTMKEKKAHEEFALKLDRLKETLLRN